MPSMSPIFLRFSLFIGPFSVCAFGFTRFKIVIFISACKLPFYIYLSYMALGMYTYSIRPVTVYGGDNVVS
jgi:hypothetical protein